MSSNKLNNLKKELNELKDFKERKKVALEIRNIKNNNNKWLNLYDSVLDYVTYNGEKVFIVLAIIFIIYMLWIK